jgi:uncharacterized Zn finger protein
MHRQHKKAELQRECSCGADELEQFRLTHLTGYQIVSCTECGLMYQVNPPGKKDIRDPIVVWVNE